MVIRAHTTWCQVSDMDRAVQFYRDTLGLVPSVESPYWTQFELGGVTVALHPRLEGASDPLGIEGKGWYLGLATDDLRSLRGRVESSEGHVVQDYRDVPGGVVLTVTDPDGNPIQIFQEGVTAADLR